VRAIGRGHSPFWIALKTVPACILNFSNAIIFIMDRKGGTMNCPKHIKETTGPDALKKVKEREELEELTEFLAGPEEDYIS
jgi:hypothetical protein